MKLSAKKLTVRAAACVLLMLTVALCALPAFADSADTTAQTQTETTQAAADNTTSGKAMASGIAIGIAAAGGALAMGIAVAKSTDSISRQPEAESKIRTTLMLGLVFIETAIIYALLVVILIIFVL